MIVVRHAHAGDKRRWHAPDERRPLSPRGATQAAGLLVTLAEDVVDTVWTSPSVRCLQTVDPLARARDLTVRTTPVLAKDVDPSDLLAWLLELGPDAPVLVCTHGEVLRGLFDLCHDNGLIRESSGVDTPKGGGWRVRSDPDADPLPAGRPLLLTYLAPRAAR